MKISLGINPCLISRATAPPCCTEVSLKLPDHLCREALHRAVDESKSLSSWMAELVERELKGPAKVDKGSLIERLGD